MLKDMPQVQYRIGEAQATLMAARAFVMETQQALEADLGPLPPKGGKLEPEWDVLRAAILACVHGAQSVRRMVDDLNNTAGTTGSRMDSPLERWLRDGHQAATHALIQWRHYEDLGKTWLGHEPAQGHVQLSRA